MADKKTNTEKLTEEQKRNRANYRPEPLIKVCPKCKRFHRDHANCELITAINEEEAKRK